MATLCAGSDSVQGMPVWLADSMSSPRASGRESQQLADYLREITRVLLLQSQQWMEALSSTNAADDYRPIAPRRSYTVNVRYLYQGRGESLPYRFDDDE